MRVAPNNDELMSDGRAHMLSSVTNIAPRVPNKIRAASEAGNSAPASFIEGIFLSNWGRFAILLAVSKVGRATRFHRFTDAVGNLRRRLAALPGMIRLESTRRLAGPKIVALAAFLKAVDAEDQGALEERSIVEYWRMEYRAPCWAPGERWRSDFRPGWFHDSIRWGVDFRAVGAFVKSWVGQRPAAAAGPPH